MRFQFLLVRLKEFYSTDGMGCFVISIPSGAIKRKSGRIGRTYDKEFQFLLVRLKVVRFKEKVDISRISIPSGAIKSSKSCFASYRDF